MMPPDLQAHVESFWPTSVIGWLTAATLAAAAGKTLYDWLTGRRKSLVAMTSSITQLDSEVKQMNENLCGKLEEVENTQSVMDGNLKRISKDVGDLVYEWRGLDGTNGYKSIIRRHDSELIDIRRRNDRIDAVREEDLRRSGGQQRRHLDRELNNLMPEEREEKA
jgi:hypothetical protein